ncbi:hypothetical protein E2562_010565 [Oryza meyeriana var. granulata]|uniref:Uncharacterized protein n=1 Tax=Oryza meyeriana var. granulata TaxID=110450 RepID=A0A6G1BUY9_9ORYZ|nr:hypothetical protein E2562_010565 [Oryza meyeriana var. granulata]
MDVNYVGMVWLKTRRMVEAALQDSTAVELRAAHKEIRADMLPLFLAASNGDTALVRALLSTVAWPTCTLAPPPSNLALHRNTFAVGLPLVIGLLPVDLSSLTA